MKIEQIAIQLYTLRDFSQTPADFAATMHRVREIGFHAAGSLVAYRCCM